MISTITISALFLFASLVLRYSSQAIFAKFVSASTENQFGRNFISPVSGFGAFAEKYLICMYLLVVIVVRHFRSLFYCVRCVACIERLGMACLKLRADSQERTWGTSSILFRTLAPGLVAARQETAR